MAAPIVVAAAKFAAKQMAKKAISKAAGGSDGGGMSGSTKTIIASIVIFVLVFTGSIVFGIMSALSSLVPTSEVVCHGPSVALGDDPHEDGGLVTGADGSGGSNIPFPEEDSSKIVYPVPNPLVVSGFEMRQVPAGTADFHGTGFYFRNGADFAQPMGSPVLAMADGIVAQSAPNNNNFGYGTVVTLHHMIDGKKYSSTYGHVLPGSLKFKVNDTVKAGDIIAGVGSEGNSSGAHLHFVLTNGIYSDLSERNKDAGNNIDPIAFLDSKGAVRTGGTNVDGSPVADGEEAPETCDQKSVADGSVTAWGGHKNGEIPEDQLAKLSWAPHLRVANAPAKKLEELNKAYKAEFGVNLPLNSAYKSIADQNKKPGEGSDIAGWAKSVEMDNPPISFDSKEYKWLSTNAAKHSWMNPIKNREDGSTPLPTRWVYFEDETSPSFEGSSSYHAYAQERLEAIGITQPSEMSCLIDLWNRESNWNPAADNPTSDAMGIPQAMMPAHFGPDWQTNEAGRNYLDNPEVQIDWGLDYIVGRYKTPCGAIAFWDKNHWY